MAVPNWLLDFFATLMIVIAVYFAGRLVVARTHHRKVHVEVNVAELVMGVAMAGMFRSSLNLLPNGLWEVIFTGMAVWFVIENVRFVSRHGFVGGDAIVSYHRLHYPQHVVMSLSMLYMYLAGATATSTVSGQMAMAPTGTTADFVFLPLLFAVLLGAFAVWQLDAINRLVPAYTVIEPDLKLVTSPSGDSDNALRVATTNTESVQVDPLERWQVERWLAPRLESVCLIAMSIAMVFLLVLML